MKKFMLLIRDNFESMKTLSPEEMQQLVGEHVAWAEELGKKGIFVSGDGLDPGGKFVGADRLVTDGPYMETKDIVGGFYIINADNIDGATEIAKQCPGANVGSTVEVRPIMDY